MNTFTSNRFAVVSRTCYAPKSGGGKYRRPVRVVVIDTTIQYAGSPIRKGIVAEWSNVDSRYSGPRSEHGQALQAARELAATLNAKSVDDSMVSASL